MPGGVRMVVEQGVSMGKYLLRRVLQVIPVVLGTTLLVYALVFALPGDPVKAMFGDKPVNPAVAAQIRAEYNLDKPFIVQYFIFLKNALTLDFGKTFSGQLVIDEIGRAFPVTIKLAIMAFVFEAIFGVVFGVISGLKKGKWYDTVILIVSLLLISVPTFVTGFLGQYFLGVKWSILPVTAGNDPTFIDLLMPAMVLGSVSMAYIIRLTRSEISSNIAEDYVRTARAKGMSNRQVMLRHVLRNSLIPVVTYLGQDIAALMGGAMISETIFNIHGIGWLTYQSILKGEGNLVVSIVTLLMLIFVVCNLIVDLLYAALDPRIRYA
jgi:oligopeptide transport system permease protein